FAPIAGASSYRVTYYTGGTCAGSPSTLTFPGPPPLVVSPLTNGQQYCFTVAALVSGVFTTESSAVTSTPGAPTIYQTIEVNRPEGTLVISQRCSSLPFNPRLPDFTGSNPGAGDFDPTNPDYTAPSGDLLAPETRCLVNLSGPRLSHLVNGLTTVDM